MKYFYSILFCFLSTLCFGQNDPFLEDLGIYTDGNSSGANVKSIGKLNEMIKDTVYSNASKAAKYAHISYTLSTKIEFAEGQVDALMNLSRAMIFSNELDSAFIYAETGLSIAERANSDELKVKAHEMLGNVYTYKGNYDKAADEYFKTIKIAEKVDDELTITSYANLGHVFKMIGNVDKSRKYSKQSYDLGKKYKDTAVMITALNLLGLVEKGEKNPQGALTYLEEGLQYARQTDNLERQSQILYNMANIYFNLKEYDKGFVFYDESMEISKVNDSYSSVAIGFHGGSLTYLEIGQVAKSSQYADSALHYALLSKNYEIIMESYALKAEVAKTKGSLQKSLMYLELAYVYKDSLNFTQLNAATLDAEGAFKNEKARIADSLKQIENDLKAANEKKVNDQKVQSREILLWISGFILIIVTIGIYFLYKNNKLIKAQHALVNTQKDEIQIQHQEITDSINYAKRIQDAIISKEGEWKKISPEHFIFFKPKDVVSGDFYWVHHNAEKNRSIWAVADCTGHGVPGAFMSMLGIGFLNEIIIENGISNPSDILEHLRTKIIDALAKKEGGKSKDGMDISLCVWDKNAGTLEYAGANNPLWIIRKGTLENPEIIKRTSELPNSELSLHEIAPDKMPIGYFLSIPPPFTTKKINVQLGDVFVLITDGFADQFGGENGKKFKYSPLKELILNLQSKPTEEHGNELDRAFETWRGNEEQVDDVCIVGVKVNS